MAVLMVPDDKGKIWPSLGGQVCDWIEDNLCFGPGDKRGEPAVLDAEKRALTWRMYEIYPKGHPEAGRRRFKRVGLSLPKGMAKTEYAAWIAACELHSDAPVRFSHWDENGDPVGMGVTDPYIPLVAYTEEQSDELCYGALKAILELSPIGADFDIGLERIMRRDGAGKCVSISASPSGTDGARTTFCVFDETHHFTLPRLKQAHQTMMNNLPKRKLADAWALETTTAPEPGAGSVAEKTMEYAQAVHEGRAKDARLFYFHRQSSDRHDLNTEAGARAAVIEASGPAAAWRDIESIVEMWRQPTTDRTFWERVWCNRLVKSASKAFDSTLWKSRTAEESPVKDGDLITLGFDGGLFHDASGLVATHIETGYQWCPGSWECPFGKTDWQVPAEEVDDMVSALFERYDVVRFYADPPYWQAWVAKWAGQYGADKVIDWWTNNRKRMTYALEGFNTALKDGSISHDGSDVVARHIANAHRQELLIRDEEGKPMWLIQKERPDSPLKIDLAMAAVLSWEARTDYIASGVGATYDPNKYADEAMLDKLWR